MDGLLHPVGVQTAVNTTASAADDDVASHCDINAIHPGHLLLSNQL